MHTRPLLFILILIGRTASSQISFEHLTTADGLSQSTVWELMQDRKGFIWMATSDGLNRYDGNAFKIYRHQPRNAATLPINNIGAVYADHENGIWVAPRNQGLYRLNKDGETFTAILFSADGKQFPRVSVTGIAESAGKLWISTATNGLFYYDYATNSIRSYQAPQIENNLITLSAEPDGRLWIGSRSGRLLCLHPENRSIDRYDVPFIREAPAHHRTIQVIRKDTKGRYWVGTNGQGLYQFDPVTGTFRQELLKQGVYETVNVISDVLNDKKGNLWILTDYGLWFYPDGNPLHKQYLLPDPENAASLSTHALKKGLCDADGNLWIGSWLGGVNISYAQPPRFTAFDHQPHNSQSLLADQVTAIAYDRTGSIWAGSTRGVTVLSQDRKQIRRLTMANSRLRSNDINALHTTPSGNVLISTWPAGFAIYTPSTGLFTPYVFGKSKSVKAMANARSGKIWIGTHERELYLFNETTGALQLITAPAINQLFQQLDINALCEDFQGNLWIGTYNSGLIRWHPQTGKIRHFISNGQPGGLGSNGITTLFEDSRHRFWIGTNGSGLQQFNPESESFSLLTTRQGLANNYIASVLEDPQHRLWLATNGGISCFIPSTGQIENYNKRDGLTGTEFLPDAATVLPTGELAFGNMQGLILFRPDQVRRKNGPPIVYLSDLSLFNRPFSPLEEDAPSTVDLADATILTFRPNQSVFTIYYTGLSFLRYRNSKYAYKLEGFDDDWNMVGTRRSAPYSNLREGEYLFHVKAMTGNSNWSPVRTVKIRILPPWYRTWWAYLLYGLLLLGSLYLLRRTILIRERLKADLRIKQLEAEAIRALDDAKTSFFTNISHEFRTPLTLILTPLDRLVDDPAFSDRLRHQFQTIQRNAQRLLRLINQLLDLSKLESQSLKPDITRNDIVPFIERIVHYFDELASRKRISLIFSSDHDSFTGHFDADMVEKITYNLLSNAIKFTPEGGEIRVTLLIHACVKDMELRVSDTGTGISAEGQRHIFERFYQENGEAKLKKSGTGVGLALTRELVELHKGRITVQSALHTGTTFIVWLPLDEAAFPAAWVSQQTDGLPEGLQPVLSTAIPEQLAMPAGKSLPLLLIVEDNDELRQYLSESFSGEYQVLVAANGLDGIELARKHIPDLILSDWLMPEMDGTEFCQAIRVNEKTSHIPFLLLTSRSANQSQITAFGTGIDDYMTKPFNLGILETKIRSMIRNRQLLREKWSKKLLASPADIQLPPIEEQFIRNAISIIEMHMDDPNFDTEQLEQAMNMSRMQFYRKLRAIMNLSGTEFIRQVRLKRALQLLESGHFNVSEVAWQVGFNDPAYFSRCFKKEFGKAPQEFLTRT